jgi:hypothetical protein
MKAVAMVLAVALTTSVSAVDSLPSPTGAGATEPYLVVGKNGEIHMTWLEPADSGFALKFSTYAGGSWTRPSVIRSGRDFFLNYADIPSVAVLDDGRLAAHWLQRTGKASYAYGIRIAQSADSGHTWTRPVTPHRDTAKNVEHGFVAMWAEGSGLGVLWLDGRASGGHGHSAPGAPGGMMLMASTIDRAGKLGPEQIVDSRTCDCCQNSVAMGSNGPIVAYRNRTPDEVRDIFVARVVDGKWTYGVPVHADNWKINACPVNGPAIDASGGVVAVAWFTGARDTNKVNVAFSKDGASFGLPIRVDGGQPGGRVDVVVLSDGSAIVSWLERTAGDAATVQARLVTRLRELGPTRTIATSTGAKASGFPRMVLSGEDVYFAWTVASRPSRVRIARAATSYFR